MAEELIELVEEEFPDRVLDSHSRLGNDTVFVDNEAVPAVVEFLRDDERSELDMLRYISCVDYDDRQPRFEVVYILYSMRHKHMLHVRTPVEEDDCTVPSIHHLYNCAAWIEREVWDMYGIEFENHPDLRRILLYEEFDGHPLRKDYPKQKGQPRTEFIGEERDAVEEYKVFHEGEAASGSRD
ncbi:MAG: NADH-quinone oxidoreductase subunit C [Bradymonadaceae bacterium]